MTRLPNCCLLLPDWPGDCWLSAAHWKSFLVPAVHTLLLLPVQTLIQLELAPNRSYLLGV